MVNLYAPRSVGVAVTERSIKINNLVPLKCITLHHKVTTNVQINIHDWYA